MTKDFFQRKFNHEAVLNWSNRKSMCSHGIVLLIAYSTGEKREKERKVATGPHSYVWKGRYDWMVVLYLHFFCSPVSKIHFLHSGLNIIGREYHFQRANLTKDRSCGRPRVIWNSFSTCGLCQSPMPSLNHPCESLHRTPYQLIAQCEALWTSYQFKFLQYLQLFHLNPVTNGFISTPGRGLWV